jgi:hypothetical protein
MPSILNEALEWLDRAEQAQEVAGQLTDPSARKAVLELAESSIGSREPPLPQLRPGEGNWPRKISETGDFSCPFLGQTESTPWVGA